MTIPSSSSSSSLSLFSSYRPNLRLLSGSYLLYFLFLSLLLNGSPLQGVSASGSSSEGVQVAVNNFEETQTPFFIACFVLFSSFVRILWHKPSKLSANFPESCVLITVGVAVGGLVLAADGGDEITFSSSTFFLYLLPPIIFDAGYFMQNKFFFDNLGSILLFAVVGTLFNTFAIGCSLYGVSSAGWMGFDLNFVQCLIFASLISAVDPVAVLSVFEEVHVNETLYILVFGESILNDAVSVVLYRVMISFDGAESIASTEYGLAIATFFVVSSTGIVVGLIMGCGAAYITKHSSHVPVIEPLVMLFVGYLSYLICETFHLSGIISILFCGVVMKHYCETNVSAKSLVAFKYILKMLSSTSESIVFLFLGIATVSESHHWHVGFIMWTLLFCLVYRFISTIVLSFIMNKSRLEKISFTDQFIVAYGGLRGAVAFSLAFVLELDGDEDESVKNAMITTTLCVIYFTVFIQGSTIKPLLEWLHVKRSAGDGEKSLSEKILPRIFNHLSSAMDAIVGRSPEDNWQRQFKWFDRRYLQPILEKERSKNAGSEVVNALEVFLKEQALERASEQAHAHTPLGAMKNNEHSHGLTSPFGSSSTLHDMALSEANIPKYADECQKHRNQAFYTHDDLYSLDKMSAGSHNSLDKIAADSSNEHIAGSRSRRHRRHTNEPSYVAPGEIGWGPINRKGGKKFGSSGEIGSDGHIEVAVPLDNENLDIERMFQRTPSSTDTTVLQDKASVLLSNHAKFSVSTDDDGDKQHPSHSSVIKYLHMMQRRPVSSVHSHSSSSNHSRQHRSHSHSSTGHHHHSRHHNHHHHHTNSQDGTSPRSSRRASVSSRSDGHRHHHHHHHHTTGSSARSSHRNSVDSPASRSRDGRESAHSKTPEENDQHIRANSVQAASGGENAPDGPHPALLSPKSLPAEQGVSDKKAKEMKTNSAELRRALEKLTPEENVGASDNASSTSREPQQLGQELAQQQHPQHQQSQGGPLEEDKRASETQQHPAEDRDSGLFGHTITDKQW
eukprot:Nk52_evm17s305 gene=Nk52_evmTU17s305